MKKLLLLFAVLLTAITASGENYILYTSTDGEIVNPNEKDSDGNSIYFGAKIVSNTYENGQGKIMFDGDVITIDYVAFQNCKRLATVVIPKSVRNIGKSAFQGCTALKSVEIPNSVTMIGKTAFSGCESLETVVVPRSVETIGSSAFERCKKLTSFLIGKSVAQFGSYTLSYCTSLSTIISLNTTPPSADEYTFRNVPTSSCILKVPAEAVEAYKAAAGWKLFWNNIVALTHDEYLALGIESPIVNSKLSNSKSFNLSGQQVGDGAKGIVIKDGRKTIKR